MSDLISRQGVIEVLSQYPFEKVVNCISIIEEFPSAQPERKTGQWQEDPSGYGFWICSACGFVSEASGADLLYNFCPNCGADMRGDSICK